MQNDKMVCQKIISDYAADIIDNDEMLFRMAIATKDFIHEYVEIHPPLISKDALIYLNQRTVGIGEPNKELATELGLYINIFSKNFTIMTASIKDLDSDMAILAKKNLSCEVIENKFNKLLKVLSEYDMKIFSDAIKVLERDNRKYVNE